MKFPKFDTAFGFGGQTASLHSGVDARDLARWTRIASVICAMRQACWPHFHGFIRTLFLQSGRFRKHTYHKSRTTHNVTIPKRDASHRKASRLKRKKKWKVYQDPSSSDRARRLRCRRPRNKALDVELPPKIVNALLPTFFEVGVHQELAPEPGLERPREHLRRVLVAGPEKAER
jgi:hypothetical protein